MKKKDKELIEINIHKTHRQYTDNNEIIKVPGNSIGTCIENLIKEYPGMKDAISQKNGKLHNAIEIYLNMESTYPDELKKPVKKVDKIYITLMISGG